MMRSWRHNAGLACVPGPRPASAGPSPDSPAAGVALATVVSCVHSDRSPQSSPVAVAPGGQGRITWMGPARGARWEPRPGAPSLAGTECRHQQPRAHRAQPTLRTGTGRKHNSERKGRRPHSAADPSPGHGGTDRAVVRARWRSAAGAALLARACAPNSALLRQAQRRELPAGKAGRPAVLGARCQAPSIRPHQDQAWQGTRKCQLPCHVHASPDRPSARTSHPAWFTHGVVADGP